MLSLQQSRLVEKPAFIQCGVSRHSKSPHHVSKRTRGRR